MPSVDETHSPARAYDVDKPSHEPCHFSLSFQVESCAISVFIFSSSLLPFLRAHFSTSYVSHNSFSATFRFVREKGVSERERENYAVKLFICTRCQATCLFLRIHAINRQRFFLHRLLKVFFPFRSIPPLVCLFLHLWLIFGRVCMLT